MKEKKGSKGLVVTIIILIILLLGAAGFVYYGYGKYNNLDEKYSNLNEKCKDTNNKLAELQKTSDVKQVESENYININGAKVYAIGVIFAVYSYNDNMYFATANFGKDDGKHFLSMFNSENLSRSNDYAEIVGVDVDVTNVNRVFISNNFYTTDAQQFAYFIFKDGSVKRINSHPENSDKQYVLKDYKVEKITKVSCNKRGTEYCENLKYELLLKDGTTKEVVEE